MTTQEHLLIAAAVHVSVSFAAADLARAEDVRQGAAHFDNHIAVAAGYAGPRCADNATCDIDGIYVGAAWQRSSGGPAHLRLGLDYYRGSRYHDATDRDYDRYGLAVHAQLGFRWPVGVRVGVTGRAGAALGIIDPLAHVVAVLASVEVDIALSRRTALVVSASHRVGRASFDDRDFASDTSRFALTAITLGVSVGL